ncbi:hypothetical protein FEM48_Zijuj01G0242800 [Ziziphus jujuba var. spinosa]|uniref:FAS1 domain-containing protein n=1 Tax=Ziziphus jujuba var. spinosa TaxID=714518 RepID=A0A978W4E8_ZIZJJ|nr:hypothetical protein FEM48_Zijuj01G0242800 [Ziziphus jujuba var. spinosa]
MSEDLGAAHNCIDKITEYIQCTILPFRCVNLEAPMASKSLFSILVLVVLLSIQAEGNNNFNLAMASKSLSDKGYHAMSMISDVFYKTHDVSEWLSGNSTLTVFCPPDGAFFFSKYPQPPLTLLQYHVVPLKLDIEAPASLPHGSKIDTLLLGHPLVVTTLQTMNMHPSMESKSLNGIFIMMEV